MAACAAATTTSSCILLHNFDVPSPETPYAPHYVDRTGTVWDLSSASIDIDEIAGEHPLLFETATGRFSAIATRPDAQALTLMGDVRVCVVYFMVIPF